MSPGSEEFTVGVEEEYQIIDPVTRELSSDAEAILREAQKTLHEEIQPEIHLSQLEVATPVCRTISEVRTELTRLRRTVMAAAASRGKQIASSGSHPFSYWKEQQITPQQRYTSLEQDYQQLAREQSIFGYHVHVGLADREVALQVINHARPWLAVLLVLSSSSPFWWGSDTGYASYRTQVWARWPVSGPPPLCSSLHEYSMLARALVNTGSVADKTKIYWDMRLSERYNTVEVRVMDACMTVDEAVMIAGLVRALVRTGYERVLRHEPLPAVRHELVRAANWHAARYGLDEALLDVIEERALPARGVVKKFMDMLRPALERHGDWQEISMCVDETLSRGVGAARQREIYRRAGRMQDVVDFILLETARGIA